jgi:hypothetical protein
MNHRFFALALLVGSLSACKDAPSSDSPTHTDPPTSEPAPQPTPETPPQPTGAEPSPAPNPDPAPDPSPAPTPAPSGTVAAPDPTRPVDPANPSCTTGKCKDIQCFRAVTCVRSCGDKEIMCGCCGCAPGYKDALGCRAKK